jgi:hypothetical protein
VFVRLTYAENLALLAKASLRFLETAQIATVPAEGDDSASINFDLELHALREIIQVGTSSVPFRG